MKSKRILALTGAVILITLYVSSIIFALMDSPLAENLLLVSLFCTIVIPAVLYGYCDILKRKNNVQKANDCLFLTQYAVVRFFHSSILTASAVSCHFFIIPPL